MAKPELSMDELMLSVTAGPSRDTSTHKPVPVNGEKPLHFDTEHITTDLYVRIQGLRHNALSSTSPYFSSDAHKKDKYSISFAPLVFKKPVNGDDLVLGNDFDYPINKSLPPGFNFAWQVAKWVVDPGLEGDPQAEKPWLEGRVLSSVNVLDSGERSSSSDKVDVLTEGLGTHSSEENAAIPHDSAKRMKYFLTESHRKAFTFEKDEKYWMDFYNPYLDFNEFALHLPGVSIHILKYWDGQPLRYVLKNRADQTVYLVVQFTLVSKDGKTDVSKNIEGGGKEHTDDHEGSSKVDEHKVNKMLEKARGGSKAVETSPDDVD